jgi:hypothetical protein
LTAKPRIIAAISVLVVASWAMLLLSAFVVFKVVLPISAPPKSTYDVVLAYAVLKAFFGAIVFGAWLYSFYVLRDAYARLTGLDGTPSSSASRRTPGESTAV